MATTRKSNGSSKPRLRASGKYQHRIRVKRRDGSWGQKSFSADTAKEARRLGDQYQRLIETGFDASGAEQRIEEYLPLWLERHQQRTMRRTGRDLSVSTTLKYQRTCEQLIEAIGSAKIKSLNTPTVEEAIYFNNAAPHTALARYSVLVLAFKSAVTDGILDFNLMDRIDRPFLPKEKDAVFFEQWELDRIFEAAKGTRWQYALQIHVQLGCRISELLALRESDVDYKNKTVSISKSTLFLSFHYGTTKPTKNYETRIIQVSDETLDLFRRQKDFRTFQYGKPFRPNSWNQDSDQLIFPNKISGLWNQHSYLKDLDAEVYSKTGITRPDRKTLGTHCFRHSAGAILISNNIPLKVVSEFLGHKSQAVTERVYAHVLQEPKEEIASILSKVLKVS